MDYTTSLLIFGAYVALIIFTPIQAYRKGRSVIGWLAVAVLSSPILALIIMAATARKVKP